jgi:hypothetical protein
MPYVPGSTSAMPVDLRRCTANASEYRHARHGTDAVDGQRLRPASTEVKISGAPIKTGKQLVAGFSGPPNLPERRRKLDI